MNIEKFKEVYKQCLIDNKNFKDYREIKWTSEVTDLGIISKYSTIVDEYKIIIEEGYTDQWDIYVYSKDGDLLYTDFAYTKNAAKFLSIVKTNPIYWDKEIASQVLADFLNSLDLDYTDIYTVTDFGWDDFIEEDLCEEDETESHLIKVVLFEGAEVYLDEDDEYAWKVKEE